MQTAKTVYSYAPIGPERPEPYPDGFVPDALRWSGREYARVQTREDAGRTLDEYVEPPVLHDGVADHDPAPADTRLTTARTSTMARYIAADRLPARRLVELRHVTHDPGMLALHGQRLYGAVPVEPDTIGGPLDPEAWVSPEPRIHEVRVGAVLVAFDRTQSAEQTRRSVHVRAWRVPPAGPPVLVYHADDPRGDEHLIALSALLDEPLETAFLTAADRYAGSDPAPPDQRILQMRAAIDRWRFADDIAQRAGNTTPAAGRRRRRRAGKARPAATAAGRPANLLPRLSGDHPLVGAA